MKTALLAARPLLEPKLDEKGLVWNDLAPIFNVVTDNAQVEKLVADPPAFCQEMWESGQAVEAAKVLVIFFMRPSIEPHLPPPLDFESCVAMLRQVDTYDELQTAVAETALVGYPKTLLQGLGDAVLVTIIRNVLVDLLLNAGVNEAVLQGIGGGDDPTNPPNLASCKDLVLKVRVKRPLIHGTPQHSPPCLNHV